MKFKHRTIALCSLALIAMGGCAGAETPIPETILIPAGPFIMGSDRAEREAAYRLDEVAYGHSVTRRNRWYEGESPRHTVSLFAFHITRTPITNAQYAAFVAATGRPAPDVDARIWAGYRLNHPYGRTRRHAWTGGRPPTGREDHPVVLVSHADARAYASWLGKVTGDNWRLPAEAEWEKAVRGTDGRRFPWGEAFDPTRLNSADKGPFDTVPAGRFASGAGPFGLLDGAGQVFEWTVTPHAMDRPPRPGAAPRPSAPRTPPPGPNYWFVKGGSWDDKGCGVCRPAARHSRPGHLKHILIGFRLIVRNAH